MSHLFPFQDSVAYFSYPFNFELFYKNDSLDDEARTGKCCQLQHWQSDLTYYRPQRSCGKVMFLHLSVILFTGGVWQTPPGRYPPEQTPPHPPGRQPPGQTPPFGRHPLIDTPLWDMVNKPVVRILLECILVFTNILSLFQ